MESEVINSTANNTTCTGNSFFRLLSVERRSPLRWRLIPILAAAIVLIPVGTILSSFFAPASDVWQHLVDTTLPTLLSNTFWLALGVACGVTALGVSLAWVTAVCEFPGRKFFSWALLLPLAIPAYVTAFVAIGLFDYVGPVQTALRSWLGPELSWFPDVRSRGGVIIVMILAFYPYVYLLARNAFLTQGRRSLEAAQTLGLNRTQGFFKLALPMARPWIASGLMLALMETLADFGTVAVFNYDTFTTAIYKAWFAMFSLPAASQLASLLIVIVFALILIEQQLRSRVPLRRAQAERSRGSYPSHRLACLAGCRVCLGHIIFCIPFTGYPTQHLGRKCLYAGFRRALSGISLAFSADIRPRRPAYLFHRFASRLRNTPSP